MTPNPILNELYGIRSQILADHGEDFLVRVNGSAELRLAAKNSAEAFSLAASSPDARNELSFRVVTASLLTRETAASAAARTGSGSLDEAIICNSGSAESSSTTSASNAKSAMRRFASVCEFKASFRVRSKAARFFNASENASNVPSFGFADQRAAMKSANS